MQVTTASWSHHSTPFHPKGAGFFSAKKFQFLWWHLRLFSRCSKQRWRNLPQYTLKWYSKRQYKEKWLNIKDLYNCNKKVPKQCSSLYYFNSVFVLNYLEREKYENFWKRRVINSRAKSFLCVFFWNGSTGV